MSPPLQSSQTLQSVSLEQIAVKLPRPPPPPPRSSARVSRISIMINNRKSMRLSMRVEVGVEAGLVPGKTSSFVQRQIKKLETVAKENPYTPAPTRTSASGTLSRTPSSSLTHSTSTSSISAYTNSSFTNSSNSSNSGNSANFSNLVNSKMSPSSSVDLSAQKYTNSRPSSPDAAHPNKNVASPRDNRSPRDPSRSPSPPPPAAKKKGGSAVRV